MKQTGILIVVAVRLALATTSAGARGAEEYWPTENWRTSSPEAQGFSSAELANAFGYVAKEQINVHSLLIVRNGYLLVERISSALRAHHPAHARERGSIRPALPLRPTWDSALFLAF